MEKKLEEGVRLIGEFHGWKHIPTPKGQGKGIWNFPEWNKAAFNLSDFKYHSSWDWQIPAFSKVVLLLDKTVDNKTDKYAERYAEAITNNDTLRGFEALVGMIKFIKTNPIKP